MDVYCPKFDANDARSVVAFLHISFIAALWRPPLHRRRANVRQDRQTEIAACGGVDDRSTSHKKTKTKTTTTTTNDRGNYCREIRRKEEKEQWIMMLLRALCIKSFIYYCMRIAQSLSIVSLHDRVRQAEFACLRRRVMMIIITLLSVTPSSFLSRCVCNHHRQISRRDKNGMCIPVKTATSSCRSRTVGALLLLLLPIALNFYLVFSYY